VEICNVQSVLAEVIVTEDEAVMRQKADKSIADSCGHNINAGTGEKYDPVITIGIEELSQKL
jgi:hypothetical protein